MQNDVNPVDKALAHDSKADLTQFSKEDVMGSSHFQSIIAEENKRKKSEATGTDRDIQARVVVDKIIADLADLGVQINELAELPAQARNNKEVVHVLIENMKMVNDLAQLWGLSLILKKLKPGSIDELLSLLKEIKNKFAPLGANQAAFVVIELLGTAYAESNLSAYLEILEDEDYGAVRKILRDKILSKTQESKNLQRIQSIKV
jgi:hypothetical protein